MKSATKSVNGYTVDELTLQNREQSLTQSTQLYSPQLAHINLGSNRPSPTCIPKSHSLKFKNKIQTIQQLAEVEGALEKYQSTNITTSLDVRVNISGAGLNAENKLISLGGPSVASRLASSLGKSLNIIELSLSFEQLIIGSEGVRSLTTAIERHSKDLLVVGLKFTCCSIDSDQIKYLSQGLEKCENMITLGLSLGNTSLCKVKIGLAGVFCIAQTLQKLKNLTGLTLTLVHQSITREGLNGLGKAIGQCEKLTRLNIRIHESSVYEKLFEEFSWSLARFYPPLTTLNVEFVQYENNRTTQFTHVIAPSLPFFAKLTTLTLPMDHGDVEHLQMLQKSLKQCWNLTSLCLVMYAWNLDNASTLVEGLEQSNLTTLKLIFYEYRFSGQPKQEQEANRLGKSLSNFKRLTSLYLFSLSSEYNPAQFISTLLSDCISRCTNLTTLELSVMKKDIRVLHKMNYAFNLTALELGAMGKNIQALHNTNHAFNHVKRNCKHLSVLKVTMNDGHEYDNNDYQQKTKLDTLTPFESDFWNWR